MPASATPLEKRTAPMSGERELKRISVLIPTSRHIYRTVSYGMVVDFEDAVARASDVDVVPVPLRSRRAQAKALLRGRPGALLSGALTRVGHLNDRSGPPLVIRHMPIGSDGGRLATGPALPPGSEAFVCARRRVPVRLVAERSGAAYQAAPRLGRSSTTYSSHSPIQSSLTPSNCRAACITCHRRSSPVGFILIAAIAPSTSSPSGGGRRRPTVI